MNADNLYAAGLTREAAAQYLKQLDDEPSDFGLLERYAFAAANHSRPDAIAAIDRYLERVGQNSFEYLTKAVALKIPYVEAEKRVALGQSDYSTDDVDEPPFVHAAMDAEFLRIFAHNWLQRAPLPSAYVFAAKAGMIAGDYEGVGPLLRQARQCRIDPRNDAVYFGGDFFKDMDEAAPRFVNKLPPVQFPKISGVSRRIFLGCDHRFYLKHGAALVRSLRDEGSWGPAIHLHVYDPPVGFSAPADVYCSTEYPRVGGDTAKLYYAAIRLVRLWQLMESDGIPTIMLDADLFVGKPLHDLFDRLEKVDVALCRMPGRLHFHTQFNASVVGFNASSLSYLRRVAGYVAKCFEMNVVPWCLDQISLNCILREMQGRGVGPKTVAVGPGVYDGTYNAALWPQKVTPDSPYFDKWKDASERFAA